VAAYPNVGYTHQGWLSEDHRSFFVDDELDELAGSVPRTRTLVWDVSDLEDPVLQTEYLGTTSASDHNLYVRGRYMYQSNYVSAPRGRRRGPAHPVEGYFDTVPYGTTPGFAGSGAPSVPGRRHHRDSVREGPSSGIAKCSSSP
jgi:choice-of-anchor B domain-containing protein